MNIPLVKIISARLPFSLAIAAAFLISNTARATSDIWDGDTDSNWTNPANWAGGNVPGTPGGANSDTATFNSSLAPNVSVTIDSGRRISRLVFSGTATAYTFGGGPFSITSAANVTVTDNISISADTVTTTQTINVNITAAGGAAANTSNNLGFFSNGGATSFLRINGNVTGQATSTIVNALHLQGNRNGEVAGVIAQGTGGTMNVVRGTGVGTWTLSGNNTYNGTTVVNAPGTLLINGDQSGATGAVSVNAGTLGGSGTIGGNTTIAGLATLAPGNVTDATTTLSFAGTDVDFASTDSKLSLDITGTAAGSFDRIAGVDLLTQNGDITLTLSGSYTIGDQWDLLDFSAKIGNFDTITLTGSYSGTLVRTGELWTNTIGGNDWQFDQASGILSVVPEPSLSLLLSLGLTFMFLRRNGRQVPRLQTTR